MKNLIDSHIHNIYLKPGEVVVAREPVLVSTVLGSCVAVTMFSPTSRVGAICHAMLPDNTGRGEDLRYVDTALRHIFRKVAEYGDRNNLVVKLFGGARVLDVANSGASGLTVGEQNVARAIEILGSLGLAVSSADTGGIVGRKLYFCTRDGDVYLRRMRQKK
ncbi:MAG: chemotaxis protein CheD [Deltaproteobacteria bacterium]|nr:chemotaxis protein CheD [Deltaproteobacteria bacterium]